jgi:hypothetical protein
VILAIDCGVSRCTGAVWLQCIDERVNVFADYYAEGLMSTENALAIREHTKRACDDQFKVVVLDPASGARTGTGPAAESEYQKVFGTRNVLRWPSHQVLDGLEGIEILLGGQPRLMFHPRAEHIVSAMKSYRWAQRGGEFLPHPQDPQHPAEDLIDSLRGGIRHLFPEGLRPKPQFTYVPQKLIF